MSYLAVLSILVSFGVLVYVRWALRQQRRWYDTKVLPQLAATRQSVRDWELEHKTAVKASARLAETNAELSIRLLEALQHAPQPSSSILPLYQDQAPTDYGLPQLDIKLGGR